MPLVPDDYTDHTKDPRHLRNGVPQQRPVSGTPEGYLHNGNPIRPITYHGDNYHHNGRAQEAPVTRRGA